MSGCYFAHWVTYLVSRCLNLIQKGLGTVKKNMALPDLMTPIKSLDLKLIENSDVFSTPILRFHAAIDHCGNSLSTLVLHVYVDSDYKDIGA